MESFGEYSVRGEVKRYYKESFIQNSDDAYLIGYMACDGAFVKNRGYPFMSINSINQYLILDFKNRYCPDATIYFLGKKSSKRVKAISDVWEMKFPPKMSKLWNNYGIFRYKKDRRVIGISNTYFDPYMAGVIEADGFISITHRKDCRTPRLRFFITHASLKFLADIQNRLDMMGIPTSLRQHGKNVYRLQAQHTNKNIEYLLSIIPYFKNNKKIAILNDYLKKYVEPQASGELLGSENQSAAKP